jgi:hypothetical protein
MKNLIFVIIVVILQSIQVSSQVRDSLIQLTPAIGDTITISENEFFNLYPDIKGFRYAILYIRNNELLINHIYYSPNETEIKDTLVEQNIILLGNKRVYIHHMTTYIYENNYSKLITVTTNRRKYTGDLLYVDAEELILDVTTNIEISEDDFLSIPSKEINHIQIPGNSNIGAGAGIGFLSGFAIGFIIGLADGNDPPEKLLDMTASEKGLTAGIVLSLGGLILGTVIGLASTSWDEDIDINSDYDFNELKKYSKFQTVHPGYYISTVNLR